MAEYVGFDSNRKVTSSSVTPIARQAVSINRKNTANRASFSLMGLSRIYNAQMRTISIIYVSKLLANRIEITPILLGFSIMLIAGLSILIIWSQTVKVAITKPVKWPEAWIIKVATYYISINIYRVGVGLHFGLWEFCSCHSLSFAVGFLRQA